MQINPVPNNALQSPKRNEPDLPSFNNNDPHFKLVDTISNFNLNSINPNNFSHCMKYIAAMQNLSLYFLSNQNFDMAYKTLNHYKTCLHSLMNVADLKTLATNTTRTVEKAQLPESLILDPHSSILRSFKFENQGIPSPKLKNNKSNDKTHVKRRRWSEQDHMDLICQIAGKQGNIDYSKLTLGDGTYVYSTRQIMKHLGNTWVVWSKQEIQELLSKLDDFQSNWDENRYSLATFIDLLGKKYLRKFKKAQIEMMIRILVGRDPERFTTLISEKVVEVLVGSFNN